MLRWKNACWLRTATPSQSAEPVLTLEPRYLKRCRGLGLDRGEGIFARRACQAGARFFSQPALSGLPAGPAAFFWAYPGLRPDWRPGLRPGLVSFAPSGLGFWSGGIENLTHIYFRCHFCLGLLEMDSLEKSQRPRTGVTEPHGLGPNKNAACSGSAWLAMVGELASCMA
jgi:hypothetical protein